MNLKSDYQKFKKHLKNKGILYAFFRASKYFVFLARKERNKKLPAPGFACGQTRILITAYGIKVFSQDKEVTEGIGLNSALNVLGVWHSSSNADWEVQEAGHDYFILKYRWKTLPLTQNWIIKLKGAARIIWEIEMEIEEDLEIDGKRMLMHLSPKYETWLSVYEQGDFSQGEYGQKIYFEDSYNRFVGAKSSNGKEEFLPSLLLEFKENDYERIKPFVEDLSEKMNAGLIGLEMIDEGEEKYFLPGRYKFFSGEITLFKNEGILDAKIEQSRRHLPRDMKPHKVSKGRPLRVLLVNMPWEKEGCWGVRAGSRWPHIKDKSEGKYLPFPFFLSYAASLLRVNGVKVRVLDALAERMPEGQFLSEANSFQPDLLAAEVSTVSLADDLELLRKLSPEILVAICGPDINIRNPEFLNEHRFVNYVMFGEYEWTLLDLARHLSSDKDLKDIPGLIYREKGDIRINVPRPLVNLDILPWPLRNELPMGKYWDLPGNIPHPSVQMLASRGCPFRCIFCLWPQVMYQGNFYRARDPLKVAEEMDYLVKIKGFKSVYFDDDTWNIGRERILKFCGELKKRDLQNIPWAIMARPDLMDENLLTNLKASGLWAVKYGVESWEQELVDNANKRMDLRKSREMIEFSKKLGIKVHLTFTFGLPGETKETICRTINEVLKIDPDSVQFSIATPFPGTDYFDILNKEGNIISKNWSDYDGNYKSVMKLASLSSQNLENAKRRAYTLWGEHQRKKRGFLGNIKKFRQYAKENSLQFSLQKTADYFKFILIKNKGSLK